MTEKYEVIDEVTSRGEGFSVMSMCDWLDVWRSGFYDWRTRPDSLTTQRRDRLKLIITKAFERGRGAYGYRRVHRQLARWGEAASPELVRGLMAQHAQLKVDAGIAVYFCDPHSPWQRPSNENTNGLLRQYFPKGTDLSRWTTTELQAIAVTLDSRPRKILGWRTPAEVYQEQLASFEQAGVASIP